MSAWKNSREQGFSPADDATEPMRIAISGAAGRIGYALAFEIAAGGLFGRSQPIALSLLDRPSAMHLLQATRLELMDCAFPLLAELRLSTEPLDAFAGADWIVLLAAAIKREEGMARADMVRANCGIYSEHGRAINQAATAARVLVVAEPCNTNCLVALRHAPDVPREHWFALNRLEQMRAAAIIAEKAGVPANRVNCVTLWGNHSNKMYVDFHNAFVGDRPAPQVITDPAWPREVLEPTIARRGPEIEILRGATPSATAVHAILETIRSITIPTPFHQRFGAAVVSDGSYGVPDGLVFGFPLRTDDGRTWEIVEGLYLDEYAESRLAENIEELEHEAVVAGF